MKIWLQKFLITPVLISFLITITGYILRVSYEVSFIPECHLKSDQKSQKPKLITQLFTHRPMSVTLTWLQLGPFHESLTYICQSKTLYVISRVY